MRILKIVQTPNFAVTAITAAILFFIVMLIRVGYVQYDFYRSQQKVFLSVQRNLLAEFPGSDVKVEYIWPSSYRVFRIVEGVKREYYSISKVGSNLVISDVKAKTRLREQLKLEAGLQFRDLRQEPILNKN